MEREEPPARLVDPFGDEVRGEGTTAVQQFLILKGIVELCEGHSTRVKPHVDEVCLTAHGLARGRDQDDIIDIGAVQVDLIVVLLRIYPRGEVLPGVSRHEACFY